MREQLERRLEELKKEFGTGQARAIELDKQQATLHQTLLRISGAIQVLEEALKNQSPEQTALSDGYASRAETRSADDFPAHVRT